MISRLMSALAIVAFAAAIYGETLGYPFAYDDDPNITRNAGIRVGGGLGWEGLRLWTPTPRPISNLSLALNYAWGGYAVEGYRGLNVLIHVLTSLLVSLLTWLVLGRAGELAGQRGLSLSARSRGWLSLFSGLLFVSHPLATQSVVYVVQRMTSLSVLFYVAGLCVWIAGGRFSGASRWRFRLLACVLGLLSLGSKEIGATFPLVLWLWEWGFERDGSRSYLLRTLPWLLAMTGILLVLSWFYASGDPLSGYASKPFTLWERMWTEPRVWWRYLGLSFFPFPGQLSVIHDVEMSSGPWSPWTTWISWLGWLAALYVAWRCSAHFRLWSALIVWWLLQQQVEGSVLPLEPMYEHRTYLPLVGLCVVLPWGFWRFSEWGLSSVWSSRLSAAVGCAAVLGLAFAAHERAQVWRDPIVLWQDALHKAPGHPRPLVNLGMALAKDGRHEEAIGLYDRAVSVDSGFQEAHHNRAVALQALGQHGEAISGFERALQLGPGDRLAHEALAQSLRLQGNRARAVRHLEMAARLGADPRVHFQLGRWLLEEGRFEEALRWLRAARARAPHHRLVAVVYATTLARTGQLEEARQQLDSFAAGDADWRLALVRARLAWADGGWAGAQQQARVSFEASPTSGSAAATLAWMLLAVPDASLRDRGEAVAVIRQSLADSEHPNALEVRALLSALTGRGGEAAELAVRGAWNAREAGADAYAASLDAQAEIYARGGLFLESQSTARDRVTAGAWVSLPPRGSPGGGAERPGSSR